MSHFIFEWVGIALFVWFAFTGLLLWRPGYYAWSLLTGGVLLLWTLFLFDDIARGANRVRGNSIYWLIFGCCAILGSHQLVDQYLPQVEKSNLVGNINISMFFHLMLIAVAIHLAQRVGDTPDLGKVFPDMLAVLMMLAGGITAAVVPNGPGRNSLWLISASGICVWMTPFVRILFANTGYLHFSDLLPTTKVKLLLRLFVACCVAILLLVITNSFCLFVLAGCVFIVGLFYISARLGRAIVCWAMAGLGCAGIFAIALANKALPDAGLFGLGEKGFSMVYGGSSGLSILLATTGWVGALLVVMGGLIITAGGMLQTLREAPERLGLSAVWILATAIASAAFLAPGGYVSPASVIALAMTWGLWPRMVAGQPGRERSGWILIAVVFSLLGLVAVVSSSGLLGSMGMTCGLKDKGQHFVAGFLVTIVVAWVMGHRCWWLGAIGLLLAAMSGGVAELAQKFFSDRGADMDDWKAHLWGSSIAGLIYVIGLGYRHAIKMTQKGSRGRKRKGHALAWALRALVLLSVLAFAIWWSWSGCKAIDYRWKTQKPTLTISDAIITPTEKPLYLPGITNDKTATIVDAIITAVPGRNNPEMGWQASTRGCLRVIPKLTDIPIGKLQPWFAGCPFSPLAYVRKKGIVTCIEFDQPVFAIDARDAKQWLKESPVMFQNMLAELGRNQAVVFVHPGPLSDFQETRGFLRETFPDIPCVCEVTFKSGAERTVSLLRKFLFRKDKPLPVVRVLTSDINFAKIFRRYFRKTCNADIIVGENQTTSQPAKNKSNDWMNYYPDLKTFGDQQK